MNFEAQNENEEAGVCLLCLAALLEQEGEVAQAGNAVLAKRLVSLEEERLAGVPVVLVAHQVRFQDVALPQALP